MTQKTIVIWGAGKIDGVEPRHMVRAIASGLRYNDPHDPGATFVQGRLATLGLSAALYEVCGLTDAELDLVEAIVQAYEICG